MMRRILYSVAVMTSIAAGRVHAADEAMVEGIQGAPKAGVAFLDSLTAGQSIELGKAGVLKLTYLSTCRDETIRGGVATIGQGASTVVGGRIEAHQLQCNVTQPVVTSEIAVAGAAVKRVTPFDGADWREITVKTRTPTFRWPAAAGATSSVTVFDLEQKPPAQIWAADSAAAWIAYPRHAPALVEGRPYQVDVKQGANHLKSVFSIDTHLDVPNTLFYRVVSVGH